MNTLTLSLVYSKTVKFLRTVSTLRPLKTSSLWEKKTIKKLSEMINKIETTSRAIRPYKNIIPFILSSMFSNFIGFILLEKNKLQLIKRYLALLYHKRNFLEYVGKKWKQAQHPRYRFTNPQLFNLTSLGKHWHLPDTRFIPAEMKTWIRDRWTLSNQTQWLNRRDVKSYMWGYLWEEKKKPCASCQEFKDGKTPTKSAVTTPAWAPLYDYWLTASHHHLSLIYVKSQPHSNQFTVVSVRQSSPSKTWLI